MSLREFDRYVRGYAKRKEREAKLQESMMLKAAALQTAQLYNIIGASAGKTYQNWRDLQPQKLYDTWTGQGASVEDARERIARMMKRHHDRLAREAKRRVL